MASDSCTLRGLAGSAGIHVGAGFVEGSHRPEYREILAREYDSVTAGMYWSSTEPEPGVWQFNGPDTAVAEALAMAHAADPAAKLYVNEILALRPGPKQDRLYRLVQDLLAARAPLHGIGFQGHITPPFAPSYAPSATEIRATLERFAALGLEVEITEIDVSLRAATPCDMARQARAYHDLVAACLAVPACLGITTWGIGDGFTWRARRLLRRAARDR